MPTDEELHDAVYAAINLTHFEDGVIDDEETSHSDSSGSLGNAEGPNSSDDERLPALTPLSKHSRMRYTPATTCRPSRRSKELPYRRSKDRWRLRPKDELEYLRNKVVELDKLVAELQLKHPQPSKLINSHGELKDGACDPAYWKRVARSRRELASAALDENRQLKEVLINQLRVARALESAIDRHMKRMAQRLPWPCIENGKQGGTLSDEFVFALLDEGMAGQYADTEEILEASGIAHVNHQLLSTLQLRQSPSGLSFQQSEVRLLPFSASDVVTALQNCLSHGAAGRPLQCCPKILKRDSVFYAVMVDKVQIPGKRFAEVKGRHIQRCFTKPEGTVITWASYLEHEGPQPLRLLQKIWVIVEPIFSKTNQIGHGKQGTRLRTIACMTPLESEMTEEKTAQIKEMADFVVSAYHHISDVVLQAMLGQLCLMTCKVPLQSEQSLI